MSDAPRQPVPDLHSIFGMNVREAEPLEVERGVSRETPAQEGGQTGLETTERESPFTVDRVPAPSPIEEVGPVVELDEAGDLDPLASTEAAVEIERGENR